MVVSALSLSAGEAEMGRSPVSVASQLRLISDFQVRKRLSQTKGRP